MTPILLLAAALAAATAPADLPPELVTRDEASGFEATASYAETVELLRRLEALAPKLIRATSFGRSAQGRELPLVIVSCESAFTPAAARADGKPIVMLQAGIHAGEIDGKPALTMLLRDLALGRLPELAKAATLLVVPIYNVDGHEQVSPYNRPSQDGPVEGMGFRTTAGGLDLNRDHLKIVSPEAQALIGLIADWGPHLHVDLHVTNGSDHDWTLTWARVEAPQLATPLETWCAAHLPPALAAVEAAGYRSGPYVDLNDPTDPTQGFSSSVAEPRYSSGYLPLRGRPSILIETHALKPYEARVRATRAFLDGLLAEVVRAGAELVSAVGAAEDRTVALGRRDAEPSKVVLRWQPDPVADRITFPVYEWFTRPSMVTGRPYLLFRRGRVHEIEVPWTHRVIPELAVARPRGYLVPPGWPQVEARLAGHRLRVERLTTAAELEVETLRVATPKLEQTTWQGLVRMEAEVERRHERRRLPAGTLWIPADQPAFEVAVQLLEPEAPDSLFRWGLLASVAERKEYISTVRLEEQAERLLAADPTLRQAWAQALADPDFAADGRRRALWWYRRTPYWDETVGLLPAMRVLTPVDFETVPWPAE